MRKRKGKSARISEKIKKTIGIDISEQTPETEVINETKEVDTEAKIEEKKDISEKKSKVSKEELKTEKK